MELKISVTHLDDYPADLRMLNLRMPQMWFSIHRFANVIFENYINVNFLFFGIFMEQCNVNNSLRLMEQHRVNNSSRLIEQHKVNNSSWIMKNTKYITAPDPWNNAMSLIHTIEDFLGPKNLFSMRSLGFWHLLVFPSAIAPNFF